jgi:hypothetical protein
MKKQSFIFIFSAFSGWSLAAFTAADVFCSCGKHVGLESVQDVLVIKADPLCPNAVSHRVTLMSSHIWHPDVVSY